MRFLFNHITHYATITTREQKIPFTAFTTTLVLIIWVRAGLAVVFLKSFFFDNISIQADRFKNGPLFNPVFFPLTQFQTFSYFCTSLRDSKESYGRARFECMCFLYVSVFLISRVRAGVRAKGAATITALVHYHGNRSHAADTHREADRNVKSFWGTLIHTC